MHDYRIDLVFKRLLIDKRWQEPNQLGACCIVPPHRLFQGARHGVQHGQAGPANRGPLRREG
eukprot:12047271-Alexandrium_andersonii.AAC.1